MNLPETIRRTEAYLAERFPVSKMNYASMVQKKEVPVHRLSWGYYVGGLALFFFIVQVVTGLMLLFYYQPTVSDAHASVEYITEHVPGGALVGLVLLANFAANYILQHQLEDGGWNIYEGGPANVSATVKAYFGLKNMDL
jgi:hypothetical protein